MKDRILEEYKTNKKTLHAFRERVINLLTDLLLEQKITIHQITGRTKAIDSLSKKIDDKGEKYTCLADITDIVGIRIITYMESDVDAVSELIEKEFVKDVDNSIDKRKLKADQFGYRSLHIVVSLNNNRLKLKEYKRYENIKCEIQVRSVLQHAWAEIEHDLGYKGEVSIPEPYKRSFNRLSALLETADIEFDRLKNELEHYEKEVPALIISQPEFVDINKASIISFGTSNLILLDAKNIIEQKTKNSLLGVGVEDVAIKRIKYLKFKNIAQLENSLQENKKGFLNFVKVFVNKKINEDSQISILAPLMYFLHYIVAKTTDVKTIEDYLELGKPFTSSVSYQEYIDFYLESIKLVS